MGERALFGPESSTRIYTYSTTLGIYTHDVHRRWGSAFWRPWARVIRAWPPACPSRPSLVGSGVGGRPNERTSLIDRTARRPRMRTAERMAGPRRGEAWPGRGRKYTPASCAGHAPCDRRVAAFFSQLYE
jgi:hypothetical protein